jgi:transposase
LTPQLEQLARKTSAPHQLVQRAKLALLLQAHPELDNPTLARRLGQHFHWVRYWRKRWATQGFTLKALEDRPGRGRKPRLSPLQQATVKALAGELPAQRNEPLGRYSLADLLEVVKAEGWSMTCSRSTLWRVVKQDALRPWRRRSGIFPRDPDCAAKAARVLDW